MAKAKVTVSQKGAIREALQTLGVDKPATEVIAWVDQKYKLGLGKKTHGAQLVSVVKSELRGAGSKRVVRKARPARIQVAGGLERAIEFVKEVGGLDAAKAELAKLEDLRRAL